MANPLQERYEQLLIEHIRAASYPSATHMDMLEAIATPRVLAEYTMHLIERIEADEYPSIPLMRRVEGLISRWGHE